MERFTRLTAVAAPLRWANVNTDDIFPGPSASPVARRPDGRMVLSDRSRMGVNAFAAHRWNDDGSPQPDFILNRPPYDRAGILIARENFGCGSSREMAVWSLVSLGVRSIIAPSFGDIFYNNCFKNGMLPVRLAPSEVEHLLNVATDAGDPTFTVDLETCEVLAPDGSRHRFQIGEYHRQSLLGGLDEITATLARLPVIEAHEAAYLTERPWLAVQP